MNPRNARLWTLLSPAIFFVLACPGLPLKAAPEVAVVRIDLKEEGERLRPPLEFHVFGGRTVAMDLWAEGPPGTTATLEARLFQASTALAAPLGPAFRVGTLVFEGPTSRPLAAAIAFPEVGRKTEIDAQFQKSPGGEAAPAAPAGRARFFVYPPGLADPLKAWASRLEKESGLTLGVFGKGGAIRGFLRQNKVAFEDLGEAIPSPPGRKTMLVGNAAPGELEAWQSRLPPDAIVRIIVFVPDPWPVPGVYASASPARLVTKVTLPILDRLATDPASQETVVEILTRTQTHLAAYPPAPIQP